MKKRDHTTGEWAWISGTDAGFEVGVYGTKGIVGPVNIPGGRNGSVSWIDAQGSLWMFGGHGYDATGNACELNDLWRYSC